MSSEPGAGQAVSDDLKKDSGNQAKDKSIDTVLDELKGALSAASGRYEVVITEREWANYLQQHNLTEPLPHQRSRSGRHEKPGWRKLAVIIGAYLIKHQEITKDEIKVEEAAKKIHEIAKNEGIPGLPAWPTIKAALSEIHSKADTLSIK